VTSHRRDHTAGRTPRRDEIASPRGEAAPRRDLAWVRRLAVPVVILAGSALAGPDLTGLLSGGSRVSPADPAADRNDAAEAAGPAPPGVAGWPPRGDLGAATPFARDAVATAQRSGCGAARLLFAGHLPDRSRLAILGCTARAAGDNVTVWTVHASPLDRTGRLRAVEQARASAPDDLVIWAGRGGGRAFAVLLSRPEPLLAELSTRVTLARTGELDRAWQTVAGGDGVVVPRLPTGAGQLVLARRHGSSSSPVAAHLRTSRTSAAADLLARTLAPAAGSVPKPPPARVAAVVSAALEALLPGAWPVRQADVVSRHTGAGGTTALARVRLAGTAGLYLLIESVPSGTASRARFAGLADVGSLRLNQIRTSSVVVQLGNGVRRRLPPPDLHPKAGGAGLLLDGGVATLRGARSRVTVLDWVS